MWRDELFAPIVLVGEIDSVDEGIALANGSDYGLTAGFYAHPTRSIISCGGFEAGVTYVNRPRAPPRRLAGLPAVRRMEGQRHHRQGDGSFWYLPLYLREQSQTIVD